MYKNKIDSLYQVYNSIPEQEAKQLNAFSQFNDVVKKAKLIEFKNSKVKEVKDQASDIRTKVKRDIETLGKSIPSMLYPLRFNQTFTADRTLGELQRLNAFMFVDKIKDLNSIRKEIENSFDSGMIDYGNSLLEIVDSQKPNQVKLSSESKEVRGFYEFISDKIKNNLRDSGVSEKQNQMNDLKKDLQEIDFIFHSIDKKIPFVISPRQLEGMDQKEVNKIDINALHNVGNYFTTQQTNNEKTE